MPAPEMRWWGWGEDGRPPALTPHAMELLQEELGTSVRPRARVSLEQVQIPAPRLTADARARLERITGAEGIADDHRTRVLRSGGKSYVDLVRIREGRPEGAPDAVLLPRSPGQVAELLAACAELRVAVVPFGGGTSVVGGLAPLAGEHAAVVALDLAGLAGLLAVDRDSLTARFAAGTRGPALEAALAEHGLTLGHYPQSFEYVSIGGCVATRSAGQASGGYGRIDDLLLGATLLAPAGRLELPPLPGTAAGPDLRRLVLGSEGTLGVITDVALRVRPRPRERRYDGVLFESFAQGAQALRVAAQQDAAPDVARLSDEHETRVAMGLGGDGGMMRRLGRRYIRLRGYEGGCLAIVGWEGEVEDVARRRAHGIALLQRAGALRLGSSPGREWLAGRFDGPYLRDDLLDVGVMAETLETAAQWSDLGRLHEAIGAAIAGALGGSALVMCHISHVYATGASLYYTFIAPQLDGGEIDQWLGVKRAAAEAIHANGGTITHHHGIGRDHAAWLEREIGPSGVALLRAARETLDPHGVMNPGKL